jgi:carbonyl reductase 1
MKDAINTNYFGPRRVNEFFGPFLQPSTTTTGSSQHDVGIAAGSSTSYSSRIINVASAAGPNYVSALPPSHPHKTLLSRPWTIANGIAELDELARTEIREQPTAEGYGISKALLMAYTWILAKQYDALVRRPPVEGGGSAVIVQAVTPGFIATDLTAYFGAAGKSPAEGAVPPCYLLMDDTTIPTVPTGRYYGSDCIRSPLDYYRGPGEPPYESDDDLVELLPGARTAPPSMASEPVDLSVSE